MDAFSRAAQPDKRILKGIITAGGLSEPIDAVRAITNFSTGTLSAITASGLLELGAEVIYIYSKRAKLPNFAPNSSSSPFDPSTKLRLIEVQTAEECLSAVTRILEQEQIDFFVHAMAVSDYQVDYITEAGQLAHSTAEEVESLRKNYNVHAKLSSHLKSPAIVLKPTPKIIDQIRQISPNTYLVGFKLLANASDDELIEAANLVASRSGAQLVVANHFENVHNSEYDANHSAYFV